MAKEILFAVLTVPLILIISLTAYQSFFASSQSAFEQTVVNESLGTGAGTYYAVYSAKVGSATIYNGTTVCPAAVCSVDYRDGLYPMKVTVTSAAGSTEIKATYTAYAKEGYTQYVKTYTGTQSGFTLGSLLPFILVAIGIVGIIVSLALLKTNY